MNQQKKDKQNIPLSHTAQKRGKFDVRDSAHTKKDNIHISETNQNDPRTTDANDKKTSPVRGINDLGLIAFVHKKTERLASVVYLLTNDLADDEPLKSQIRRAHLTLTSELMRTHHEPSRIRVALFEQYAGELAHCRYLIDLAHIAGFISGMNAELLRQEYNALIEILTERVRSHEPLKHLLLDTSFFTLPEGMHRRDKTALERVATQFQDFDKDTLPAPPTPGSTPDNIKRIQNKRHINNVKDANASRADGVYTQKQQRTAQKRQTQQPVKERSTATKRARRETILGLLERKGATTIKDIAAHVNGCSEKTVQRELNTLISAGKIVRHGKRRWSTYALK